MVNRNLFTKHSRIINIMTSFSKIFTCLLLAGTFAFTGCQLLPERKAVNLPSEPAPQPRGTGESVSSETYYEMTSDNRERMMSGEGGGSDSGSSSTSSSGQSGSSDSDGGDTTQADSQPSAPTPKTGVPVEGKSGFIMSPNSDDPDALIDVRGLPPGTEIKDPHSPGSTILVP